MKILLNLLIITLTLPLLSSVLDFPTNLSQENREELTRILGVNTTVKSLTSPFPLGGYSGFEWGLSYEVIDISGLENLGTPAGEQNILNLPRFTVGKGLFNHVDLFLNFVPILNIANISEYGGSLKWQLYEGSFLPFSISLNLSLNSINIGDVFSNTSTSSDLISGIKINDTTVYFGIGNVRSESSLPGIHNGQNITDSGFNESQSISSLHTFVGGTYQLDNYFLAIQADRYRDNVFSLKAGARY